MKYPYVKIDIGTSVNRWSSDRIRKEMTRVTIGDVYFYVVDGLIVRCGDKKNEYYLDSSYVQSVFPNETIKNRCRSDEIKFRFLSLIAQYCEKMLLPVMMDIVDGKDE